MTNVSSIEIILTPWGAWDKMWPPAADTATAQGIGGAGPPQVAIGRASGGTPAKPGFLRSKKCAQMKFGQNLIYLLILY
jgi:hypothetical protein